MNDQNDLFYLLVFWYFHLDIFCFDMIDIFKGIISLGNEVLPDLRQACEFVSSERSVSVGITVGVLQSENRKQLICSRSIDLLESSLGIIGLVQVSHQSIGSLSVSDFVSVCQTMILK